MGERTVRQFGLDVVVPADPPPLMTIEAYIPDPSMDAYLKGMDCVPSFVHPEIPYREWFELNSLGSLIAVHEVEGSWVLGGMVQDSLQLQFAGEVERLQGEVLRFQLEMPVVEEKYATDVAWLQGEVAQLQAEATQRKTKVSELQVEVAARDASIQSLEDQLASLGIAPVTRASSSGHGRTSPSPSLSLSPLPRD